MANTLVCAMARRGAKLLPVGAACLLARCRGAGWWEDAPPSCPLLLIGVIKTSDGAGVAVLLHSLSLCTLLREGRVLPGLPAANARTLVANVDVTHW